MSSPRRAASPERPLAPPRSHAKTPGRGQGSPRAGRDAGPVYGFDHRDRAPEDRQDAGALGANREAFDVTSQWQWLQPYFSPYDHLVRGSLVVDGVNYSAYESARGNSDPRQTQMDTALKQDLISEVGCGMMESDIAVRVSPGGIKSVVLHYEQARSPLLVDADWSIKIDYALRLRDAELQQAAGAAIYRALTGPYGLHLQHLRMAYAKLDPTRAGEIGRLVARPHDQKAKEAKEANEANPPPATDAPRLQAPPAPQGSPSPSLSRSAPPLPPVPAGRTAGRPVMSPAPGYAPASAPAPPPLPQPIPAPSPPRAGWQQNPSAIVHRRSINPPRSSLEGGSRLHAPQHPSPNRKGDYASASPAELRSALDDVRALEAMSSASAHGGMRDPPVETEIATELARDRELATLGEEIAAERRRLQVRISDLHHRVF